MCPSSKSYVRDYKQERKTRLAKEGNEPNILRKQARRDMEKKGLAKPFDNKDVDHTKPISKGGTNGDGLRMKTPAANRSYPRNPDGSMKK